MCVVLVVRRLCCCVDDDIVKAHPLDVEMVGSCETPAELSDDERVAEESSGSENMHKSSGDEVSGCGLTCPSPNLPSLHPASL